MEGADGGERVQGVGFLGCEKSRGAGNEGREGRMGPGFYLSTWWPHVLLPELWVPKEVQAEAKMAGLVSTSLENQGCARFMRLGQRGQNHPALCSFNLHVTSVSYMVHYWSCTEGFLRIASVSAEHLEGLGTNSCQN